MSRRARKKSEGPTEAVAELASAEKMAASAERILAAYEKIPDSEAVRETVGRETANLVSALKDIRRILGKLRSSELEELERLRELNEELRSRNRKLLLELKDALGIKSAIREKDDGDSATEKTQGRPAEKPRHMRQIREGATA